MNPTAPEMVEILTSLLADLKGWQAHHDLSLWSDFFDRRYPHASQSDLRYKNISSCVGMLCHVELIFQRKDGLLIPKWSR